MKNELCVLQVRLEDLYFIIYLFYLFFFVACCSYVVKVWVFAIHTFNDSIILAGLRSAIGRAPDS